ncbi:hypothetical protein BASA62_003669, partial [Batrachochytrium salamandrivorans]
MKFSVLVAAAMVITSVSAGRGRGFGGCLGRLCGLKQKSSQKSPEDGSKSGSSQKSQRSSKGSSLLAKYQEAVEGSQQQPKSGGDWESSIHR